jgi:ribonucleoside-triphosphate reductase
LIVGTNPCGEISLRNAGFCNLTEIVVRPEDTVDSLREKAELAAILGTIQSTFTNFRYLRPIWKRNAEEERLLGVSMTGIYDHPVLGDVTDSNLPAVLTSIQGVVEDTNRVWAEKLGINPSVATTTVTPAGTTSSLSNKDALTQFLKDSGVPWEPCVQRPESTTVFYFPIKSPNGARTRENVTAIEHLNLWKTYNDYWSEHQVSVTINVREHEWLDVAAWVYREFDAITGISFLPYDGGSYRQAPFQECSKEKYEEMLSKMPTHLDWSSLSRYEMKDETTGVREFACVSGVCEVL